MRDYNDDLTGLVTRLRSGRVASCSEADRLLRRLDILCGSNAASSLVLGRTTHGTDAATVEDLVARLRNLVPDTQPSRA